MAGMDPRGKEDTLSGTKTFETLLKEYQAPAAYPGLDFRREDEMISENASPKQHDSVLNQNYQYLQDNIERLYNQVENLEQRLNIILTDGEPESARDSMGYGGNTPLSENLAQLCRRTQDLTERLSYLTARIDL